MFKKLFITLFTAFLMTQPAYADGSEKATILEVPYARTILVERADGERVMLHVQRGCDRAQFKAGNVVDLAINGSLNGNRDLVKTSYLTQCAIDRVESVDQVLKVRRVYNSKTEAVVRDEQGADRHIFFNSQCADVFAFRNKNIYQQGNKIVIPRGRAKCSIRYSDVVETQKIRKTKSGKDVKRPSMATQVKAVPSKNSAFVYWKKSHDNVGVSHYIVSYSRYRLDSDRFEANEMPNQVITKKNRVKITGLETDKTYFFYVMAVDKAGNTSSDWSHPVYTRTSSAINNVPTLGYARNARVTDGRPTDR